MAKASELRDLSAGFSLLSDPTRLGILKMLAAGPKKVTALCDGLGVKQPLVSHHLRILRMGRLVVGTRKGKAVVYVTDANALKMLGVAIGKLTPKR